MKEEIRSVLSRNIIFYRREAGLTQGNLAEKLNYTDKAVSKWERGESVPDIEVLSRLASLFQITLDQLTAVPADEMRGGRKLTRLLRRHKLIIPLLSAALVWLAATAIFAALVMGEAWADAYLTFIYAIPASLITLLVFSAVWGNKILSAVIASLLVWSIPVCIILSAEIKNSYLFFIIAIPAQILVALWYAMRVRKTGFSFRK